jgi:thiamine pyrophosphokinase
MYDIVLLGGLSGRLDQTVHTLSLLHKLRTRRKRVFAVTDDNVGWVLDSVSSFASRCVGCSAAHHEGLSQGEHTIHIEHALVGPTCGLLPVGVDSTVLTTRGLRWDLGAW